MAVSAAILEVFSVKEYPVSFARYSDLLVENFIPHLYLAPPQGG